MYVKSFNHWGLNEQAADGASEAELSTDEFKKVKDKIKADVNKILGIIPDTIGNIGRSKLDDNDTWDIDEEGRIVIKRTIKFDGTRTETTTIDWLSSNNTFKESKKISPLEIEITAQSLKDKVPIRDGTKRRTQEIRVDISGVYVIKEWAATDKDGKTIPGTSEPMELGSFTRDFVVNYLSTEEGELKDVDSLISKMQPLINKVSSGKPSERISRR